MGHFANVFDVVGGHSARSSDYGSRAMRFERLASLSFGAALLMAGVASASDSCSGHKLLRTPRPETSCVGVKPRIYPSPDGTLRAVVLPVDISLNATPDMEAAS